VYTQDQYSDTPAFSPDGKKILFASWGIPAPAGQHRTTTPTRLRAHRFAQNIAPSFTNGIVSIDLDGSNLTVVAMGAYESEVINATLYYSLWNSVLGASQIYSCNLDG